jgi:hypothetical protein
MTINLPCVNEINACNCVLVVIIHKVIVSNDRSPIQKSPYFTHEFIWIDN